MIALPGAVFIISVTTFALTNERVVFSIEVMRSIQRTLGRPVLRNIALVCLADGLVGMSYGAIAVGSGLDPWLPVALSVLVLAGSAEFLFVGIVAAGGSPIAAAIAGLLVNARHLPFGLAVGDVLGRGLRRVAGSHLMNDESVVFALGQPDPARRRAAYWACGVGIAVCWPLGALAATPLLPAGLPVLTALVGLLAGARRKILR
jgi:predicted branched-subunit amino acid permease